MCVLSFSCFLFCLLGFVVWGVFCFWILFFVVSVCIQFVDKNFKMTFGMQVW